MPVRPPTQAARNRMKKFVTWGAEVMRELLSVPVERSEGPRGGTVVVRSKPGSAPRKDRGYLQAAARGRIFVVGSKVIGEVAANQSPQMESSYGYFQQIGAVGGRSADSAKARPFITMTAKRLRKGYVDMLKKPYEKEGIDPLRASIRSKMRQQPRILIRM